MALTKAYALIIGISEYQDQRIPKLKYTHSDAEGFCKLLLDSKHCGIPEDNVKLLLDGDATLFNLKHSISGWLYQHVDVDSTVIVFFAGHGGVEPSRTGSERDGISKYLLPWDANKDDLFASALSNDSFNRLLSTVKSERMVIFMDACYSGGVAERGSRDLGIVENPYERLAEGHGRLVISAAKPNQLSWEDESIGHGIFTHHLLEALGGRADTDKDGYVGVMEVFRYLEKNVPDTARRLAKGDQHPLLCGDLSKDIILTVDTNRITELQVQKSREQQQRAKEIRKKRRKLFELFERGDIPQKAFDYAMLLVQKNEEELTAREQKLRGLLGAMISGGLPPDLYLTSYEALSALPDEKEASGIQADARTEAKSFRSAGHDPESKPAARFCIHCGTKTYPDKKFCIGCGKAYSV